MGGERCLALPAHRPADRPHHVSRERARTLARQQLGSVVLASLGHAARRRSRIPQPGDQRASGSPPALPCPPCSDRIINVSSISLADTLDWDNLQAEREYGRVGHAAYSQSKLALNMQALGRGGGGAAGRPGSSQLALPARER